MTVASPVAAQENARRIEHASIVDDIIRMSKDVKLRPLFDEFFDLTHQKIEERAVQIQHGSRMGPARTAELVDPNASAVNVRNPVGLIDNGKLPPDHDMNVGEKVRSERDLIYNFARLLMRSDLKDDKAEKVLRCAKNEWIKQLKSDFDDPSNFSVSEYGVDAVLRTCNAWQYRDEKILLRLKNCAPIPPFFDGNKQCVELYIQYPPPGFSWDTFAPRHLPNLRCLALLFLGKEQRDLSAVQSLLPKLKNLHQEAGPEWTFYVLYDDNYGTLPSASGV